MRTLQQRDAMGLLEYQAMYSLRNVAHDDVLCTFSNRSDWDKWCGPFGQAAWIVHHVQNHTLLGQSASSQPCGPPRWASPLTFGFIALERV